MDVDLSIDFEEASIIVKDFIRTYVDNSECNGVIIGLSGGVDSAVTAVLCKQALGKNRTKCLFLPDYTTPESDIIHQDLLVKKFDLFSKKKNINGIVKNFMSNCVVKPDKLGVANIKSRIRMILLYEYANMTNSVVCGSSNKSELLVGYFTKYGDGGIDIDPIGDIYKTQIWELAKFLEIPDEIILKQPTAGLIKGQTDEIELKIGYRELDRILLGLEKKISPKKLSSILSINIAEIERIKFMRIKSQHKRRLFLIPKIGLRTSGLDWRSPVQLG